MKRFARKLTRYTPGVRFEIFGRLGAGLALTAALGGCAASTKPADLPRPAQVSCFTLPSALSANEKKGLFGTAWMTRIERGPYVAEHTDVGGTYFRGPPGGVFYGFADGTAMPSNFHATYGAHDGGIYVPRDPAAPPHLYTYYSVTDAEVVVPPDGADCSSVRFVTDPVTRRVNPIAWAAVGAVAAVNGRAVAPPPPKGWHYASYGQSAIAGAIAGVILAEMTNADVGNIRAEPELNDAQMLADIRRFANTATPLNAPQADDPVQTAALGETPHLEISAPPPPVPPLPVPPEQPVGATATAPSAALSPTPVAIAALPARAPEPSARPVPASGRVPYLADDKQYKFLEYLSKPTPRAFAISDNGHFAAVWGLGTAGNGADADPKARALAGCKSAAGRDCVLYAVDDKVVFVGAPITDE